MPRCWEALAESASGPQPRAAAAISRAAVGHLAVSQSWPETGRKGDLDLNVFRGSEADFARLSGSGLAPRSAKTRLPAMTRLPSDSASTTPRRSSKPPRKEAEKTKTKMCIAVVDSGANLKAFHRMDDAWVGSIDIAIKKAKTAVFFGMPTGAIGRLSQPGGPLYGIEHSNDGLITFPGRTAHRRQGGRARRRHRRVGQLRRERSQGRRSRRQAGGRLRPPRASLAHVIPAPRREGDYAQAQAPSARAEGRSPRRTRVQSPQPEAVKSRT